MERRPKLTPQALHDQRRTPHCAEGTRDILANGGVRSNRRQAGRLHGSTVDIVHWYRIRFKVSGAAVGVEKGPNPLVRMA